MQLNLIPKEEISKENLIFGWWYNPHKCYICGKYREIKYTLKTLKYVAGPGRSIKEEKVYFPVCAECGDQIMNNQPKEKADGQGD